MYRTRQNGKTVWTRLPVMQYPSEEPRYLSDILDLNRHDQWDGSAFWRRDVVAQIGNKTIKLSEKNKEQDTALQMYALIDEPTGYYDEEGNWYDREQHVDHIRVTGIYLLTEAGIEYAWDEAESQKAFW